MSVGLWFVLAGIAVFLTGCRLLVWAWDDWDYSRYWASFLYPILIVGGVILIAVGLTIEGIQISV